MARFPCDACGQRIIGKASYAYPTIYVGQDQFGERLRMCKNCAEETLSQLGRNIDNNLQRECCCTGHAGPLGVVASAYAYETLYDGASDRHDFGGPLCSADLPLVAAIMRVGLPQRP